MSSKGINLSFPEIALLSLLLEVSSTPKSGNVDRDHDHPDLNFHHFIFSGVSSLRAFEKVERGEIGIGEGIYLAVKRSTEVCRRNVHFGAFLLLVPLVKASSQLYSRSAQKIRAETVAAEATNLLKDSDVKDSIFVLKAFRKSGARVGEVSEGDLRIVDERWLKDRGLNLYGWMKLGENENLIARELTGSYSISLEGARTIERCLQSGRDLNEAIVYTYHYLLSKYIDPLIAAKFGFDFAEKVRKMAKDAISRENFQELDEKLISLKVNPGSIADLIASSIYLLLIDSSKLVMDSL